MNKEKITLLFKLYNFRSDMDSIMNELSTNRHIYLSKISAKNSDFCKDEYRDMLLSFMDSFIYLCDFLDALYL